MSEAAAHPSPSTPRKPKPWWLGAIVVIVGVAILLFLGTWQMQRLKWKEELLAHIAALENAPAIPLSQALSRSSGDLDFVRVTARCPLIPSLSVIDSHLELYSLLDGAAGKRWIVSCPTSPRGDSSILVDLGFLNDNEPAAQLPPALLKPKPFYAQQLEAPGESQQITGILRRPSGRNLFTPPNGKVWYYADIPAMARALGAPNPAPVVLMLEGPGSDQKGFPKPAPIPKEIPNRHLEYALTWYGLAAALVGVYIAMLLRRRTAR